MRSHPSTLARRSLWLDGLSRQWISDGTLVNLVRNRGISGLTSNPAILENSIMGAADYNVQIAALARRGLADSAVYEELLIDDIQAVADVLAQVHRGTGRKDGYVSVEVPPTLAEHAPATVMAAQRLWTGIDRPNVMVKIPGTSAGLVAVEALFSAGINVNVTLLFSIRQCRMAAESTLRGLQERVRRGLQEHPRAVVSLFLSRLDDQVDRRLDTIGGRQAQALRGTLAIATARLVYQAMQDLSTANPKLTAAGTFPVRPLWASTMPKDPSAPRHKYVEALALPDTVITMPLDLLQTCASSVSAEPPSAPDIESARRTTAEITGFGVDLDAEAILLQERGITLFRDAYERTLTELRARSGALAASSATVG